MSCVTNIDLKVDFHVATAVKAALIQFTKDDSYEYPGERVIAIRSFIQQLDEQIEANLPDDHDH